MSENKEKWGKAIKKSIEVRIREVEPNAITIDGILVEEIFTREGTLYGYPDLDWIIEGIEGELYPIKKTIFKKTYDIIEPTNMGTKVKKNE